MVASDENTQVVTYESAEWRRNRERAIKRDQYRCQYCRRCDSVYPNTDLHVHHIRPIKKAGTHELENLVTLCNRCHNRLHNRTDERDTYPPELLDDVRDSPQYMPVPRTPLSDFRETAKPVVEVLKENGPMQLKDIAEATDYARGTIYKAVETLKVGNYIVKISRGVYGYIPTIEYRKSVARGPDERGNYTVGYYDPGTQREITDYVDDPRTED